MNRAEYRRKQRQEEKKQARFWVTQAEIDRMARVRAQEMFKHGVLEFWNSERAMLVQDVRKVLDLYQAIWRDVLGDMGLLTRDNTQVVQDRVNAIWKELDDCIMNNNEHELRKWCGKIGADPNDFGILERSGTPEELAEICLDLGEDEE